MPFHLPWPLLALPQVTTAGRFALADRDFQTRYCGSIHALHLHGYGGAMLLAGETVGIAPGDVTLSPAGETGAYDLAQPGRHWCIHFQPPESAGGAQVTLPLLIRAGAMGDMVRERMAHIAALHARGNAIAAASASLACQELLLHLVDGASAAPPSAVERAARIIDDRFDEPLTMPLIAAEVGRSQAHLARAFRARYGMTAPHRLIRRRMDHARYLLESTDLPIWRVAERVGIADPQHFNKSVRRLLGASPSAIRAAAHGKRIDPDR